MTEFTLDTSGAVMIEFAPGCDELKTWDRLDPFTQGYIEAAFASVDFHFPRGGFVGPTYGFRHIAPETLAAILKDCVAYCRLPMRTGYAESVYHGRNFWAQRTRGLFENIGIGFPPLTVSLGDDGKVRFS